MSRDHNGLAAFIRHREVRVPDEAVHRAKPIRALRVLSNICADV